MQSLIARLSPATTGADIQFSLGWAGANDLDLVVTTPGGYIISHKSPASPDGGILDVESNKDGDISAQPIENIFFHRGKAPKGKYCVYVDYCKHQGEGEETPFVVIIQTSKNGKSDKKIYRRTLHPRDKMELICSVRL